MTSHCRQVHFIASRGHRHDDASPPGRCPRHRTLGYLGASLKLVLTVESGDVVTISTVSGEQIRCRSRPYGARRASGDTWLGAPPISADICAGPVAVRGAKPGHVLEVRIEEITLFYDGDTTSSGPAAARSRMISFCIADSHPVRSRTHGRADATVRRVTANFVALRSKPARRHFLPTSAGTI